MLKLQTPVADGKCRVQVSYKDRIMMLGSCFSDNVGRKLADYGFDVCINPFGTLYNPASIARSVERLARGTHFTTEDCVWMGSGAGKVCSFWHHTSFARETEEEFLENANRRIDEAADFFRECDRLIITLGTAWCFRYAGGGRSGNDGLPGRMPSERYAGQIVSNCLKRNAGEFTRERLSVDESAGMLEEIKRWCKGNDGSRIKEKQIIFTVSPIRHLADGAHGNRLSKATLLLATENVMDNDKQAGNASARASAAGQSVPLCDYFPAYEIMMDELRDYRFYAEDMVHPSPQAVDYISERFLDWALPASERTILEENIRRYRQSLHRDRERQQV